MSGLGGLGCGVSDLDGMITGVVPVRPCEVAHELHVKCPRSPECRYSQTSQCNTSTSSIFNMTDMSR